MKKIIFVPNRFSITIMAIGGINTLFAIMCIPMMNNIDWSLFISIGIPLIFNCGLTLLIAFCSCLREEDVAEHTTKSILQNNE